MTTALALERHEHVVGGAGLRVIEPQIPANRIHQQSGQWHGSLLVALSVHAHAVVVKVEIAKAQIQRFLALQSAQKHHVALIRAKVTVLLEATEQVLADDEAIGEAECVQPAVDAPGMTCVRPSPMGSRQALTMLEKRMSEIRDFRLSKLGRDYPIAHIAEAILIIGIFLLNFYSFELSSPVNGPGEVFGQDSVYILQSLANHAIYPCNPQNHILYHFLTKAGYKVWEPIWGGGLESAYLYLKLFTSFFGLLFFISLRALFKQLNLSTFRRVSLISFSAVSVSIWFHFSAFETHCIAMPALVVYIGVLIRIRDNQQRGRMDRILLIGSLLVCGWTRVDLFRFALLTPPLLFLTKAKQHWRTLVIDMSIVCILGLAGNSLLTSLYFRHPPWKTTTRVLARWDRPDLRAQMQRADNLAISHLLGVGRAITLYGIVSPVDSREPEKGFFSAPAYRLDAHNAGNPYDETRLFLTPTTNLLKTAISATALLGIMSILGWAGVHTIRRILRGDLLHCALALQAVGGWILYTWFNPFEPFLWVVEFVPLWVTLIADLLRDRPKIYWALITAIAFFVGLHNYFAFYLSFK